MTMDRTLQAHGGLGRSRTVQTRAERIAQLIEEEKFDPEKDSPFGLPKIKVRHSKAGTKTKKEAVPVPEADAAEPREEQPEKDKGE